MPTVTQRACRAMIAERARVDRVHLRELAHVDEKDTAAEHVRQIGAGGAEDRLHVAQALRGLGGGIGTSELARRRIGRALAGHEDQSFELHARRVRADGCREIRGGDGMMGHGAPWWLRRSSSG